MRNCHFLKLTCTIRTPPPPPPPPRAPLILNYRTGHYLQGEGLQNGKIAVLKLFAPIPTQDRIKLPPPPHLTFLPPPTPYPLQYGSNFEHTCLNNPKTLCAPSSVTMAKPPPPPHFFVGGGELHFPPPTPL